MGGAAQVSSSPGPGLGVVLGIQDAWAMNAMYVLVLLLVGSSDPSSGIHTFMTKQVDGRSSYHDV